VYPSSQKEDRKALFKKRGRKVNRFVPRRVGEKEERLSTEKKRREKQKLLELGKKKKKTK